MSGNSIEDWREWRHDVNENFSDIWAKLGEHTTDIAVIKSQQQVMKDNEAARHAKTPQIAFGLFSAAVSLILLIMQLLAARVGGP